MDTISQTRLLAVAPQLSKLIYQMDNILAAENIHFRVVQGLRTMGEQTVLYDQGRTTPGKIVTNARPGTSWHQYGLAVDLVPMNPLPDWNISHPSWKRMIEVGESLGLESGSQWRTFPDNPHFQLTGTYPTSPTAEAEILLTSKGVLAVWQEAFNMNLDKPEVESV